MARRTYLSRIAQPLTSSDPVVWSTPRAAADEARPSAQVARPPARRPLDSAAAPAAPTIAASPPESRIAETAERALSAPLQAAARAPVAPAAPTGRYPAHEAAPISTADQPLRRDAAAPASRSAPTSTSDAVGRLPDVTPVAAVEQTAAEAAAWDRVQSDGTPPTAAVMTPHDRDRTVANPARAGEGPAPESEPASLNVGQRVSPTPAVIVDDVAPPIAPGEGAARPRPALAASTSGDGAPRLSIGAIEIRMVTPAPVAQTPPPPIIVQAPPSAPQSLSRGYASRFGLAQS